jgi:hypothetical protein
MYLIPTGPPHWKREWDCEWDAGYQKTGYFLDYLERRFGYGTVIRINARLFDREYDEKSFWSHCCDSDIQTLWKEYQTYCQQNFGKQDDGDEKQTRTES